MQLLSICWGIFWSYLPFLTEEQDVGYEWIFSTFKTDRNSKAKITSDFQGNVIDMTINRRIKTIFKGMFLSEFCHEVRHDYPSFGRSAVTACYHWDHHSCVKHVFLPCQKSRPVRETTCHWNLNSYSLLLL
jgi:hypothetical protein